MAISRLLRFPAAPVIAGLMAVPLIAVVWSLFGSTPEGLADLWQRTWPRYGLNTLALLVMVSVMAGSIGVATAWLVSTTQFPGRTLLSWLLILPMAAPAYIIAYLYTDLLAFEGPIQTALRDTFGLDAGQYWFPQFRSLPGAALMLALVLYPYVYLLARTAFTRGSARQWLAARSLGDSPARAFWRIALPGARPAIVGSLALVMMETLADYGVADYFAIPTFSTGIFRTWLGLGDRLQALQLAAMMLGLVVFLLALESINRKGRRHDGGKASPVFQLTPLSLSHTLLAWTVCGAPVLLGFIIPVGVLLQMTITTGDPQSGLTLTSYAWNSTQVAVLTAGLATLIALFLAYRARTTSSPVAKGMIRLSTLGYALPGALLAVGLLAPLGGLDQNLTRWARDTIGWSGGLVLSGTLAILVYALIIRFLTVSFNGIDGGLKTVPQEMDAAARSLGARPFSVIRSIHIPIIQPSILIGALLVMIDVFRELPVTLILRPFNFETLATRVYRLASDERLTEASTSALIIVVLGLIPVTLINRLGTRTNMERDAVS